MIGDDLESIEFAETKRASSPDVEVLKGAFNVRFVFNLRIQKMQKSFL